MLFDLSTFRNNIAVITDSGQSYTYGDLLVESRKLVNVMKKGLVFCLSENVLGSFVGYVAFITNDIPVVMLDGKKNEDMLYSLVSIYHPDYIWVSKTRQITFDGYKVIFSSNNYNLFYKLQRYHIINSDLVLCLTTSGSTGSPKLVRLSSMNLKSNATSIAEYLGINSEERPITSLPMYYSYGLSVINSHLIKGATILLTNRTVIQKEFWTFAKEKNATSIAGVPYTYEMLRRLRIFQMDLPCLKTMTQAGGKLNPPIVEEYIKKAEATKKKFYVMYGQTEATARMSYLPWEKALEKYSSIGIAIPGGSFSLVDSNGDEIAESDRDGELVYRGPNVSMGYAECREDLAKGDENHGILHTGDIARRDGDGYYYITGRMKRFVKIWGNRCNLDATEQLVKLIAANCACVGVDDKITVFVTEKGLDAQIKVLLSEKLRLNVRAFAVKKIDFIPKNPSGKVLYSELQKLID